ncbi:lacto-N-biose phosphorylase central domain-containing protein [Sphaerochaeta sp.]|uniref:lacto-N-biose phosphorylase central domain-containing protein n=1 Tax=Sphaerochaeta sp. TaxID=1972642 RepID=UPI003D11152C
MYTDALKIGVLSSWGKLRTWTCGGHYHEHPDLDLINILESLSGLPFTPLSAVRLSRILNNPNPCAENCCNRSFPQ